MSSPSCAQHPDVAASTVCGGCSKPLCLACATFEGGKDRCQPCVKRYFRAKRVRTALVATSALAALGLGGAWYAGLIGPEKAPEFDYGSKGVLVRHQKAQLERAPCDRTKASEYAQTLASLQDWEGALATVDAFTQKCGSFPQLRSLSYAARMRRGEFALAVRDATELLEASPGNPSYLIWRAQAHEAAKDLAAGLADFEKAFELKPGQRMVASQLAAAYQRRERPCDGARVLRQHAEQVADSGRDAAFAAQLGTLQAACPEQPAEAQGTQP